MSDDAPRPWKLLKQESGPDLNLFKVRYLWMENPRNRRQLKRLVLEGVDWVNVVALTRERKAVMVRQYRFGVGKVTTEIPGGTVEPGETSREAAERELREETGYTSRSWRYLGAVEPNPAFHDNLCHQWLAEDAEQSGTPRPDPGEDITVHTFSLEELKEEIASGRLKHSLALSALSRVFDLWSDLERFGFSEDSKEA
ncbi:MAG: NUDIX hydrolase [Planctomycetota bacterium]|jgi:8-oxo-dGTP pyrophosphatase MutT (NUDIX family)